MRIAIFTNNYLPNPFGVSKSVESFKQELEKKGHEVFVFAPCWKGFKDTDVNIFRYPSIDIEIKIRFPLPIPFSKKMEKILDQLDIDLIHSQHPNLLGQAARRLARKKNIPLVFTWHTIYDKYTHYVPFVPSFIANKWVISNAVKYANKSDLVIAPTQSAKEVIRQWGVKKEIEVVPTGVDENVFANADKNKVRNKHNISDKDFLLVTSGRLTEEKNFKFLFNSIAPVLKNNHSIKMLILGEGNQKKELEQIAINEKIENQIIFAGIIEKKEMFNYLSSGDLFVYSSKSETQGMVISEAMYSGLPVVAVNALGVKDLVKNGETGLLVNDDKNEFAKAVEEMVNNREKREKFVENGKGFAKKFLTADACTNKLLKVYAKAQEIHSNGGR